MLIDKENLYGQDQAVTATAASTNSIDHGVANASVGNGNDVYLMVVCTAQATAAGAATVDFALQDSADNSAFADTFLKILAVPKATLAPGYVVMCIQLPTLPRLRRYTRVNYTVATGPLTGGTFSAFLTTTPQAWYGFVGGYTV